MRATASKILMLSALLSVSALLLTEMPADAGRKAAARPDIAVSGALETPGWGHRPAIWTWIATTEIYSSVIGNIRTSGEQTGLLLQGSAFLLVGVFWFRRTRHATDSVNSSPRSTLRPRES